MISTKFKTSWKLFRLQQTQDALSEAEILTIIGQADSNNLLTQEYRVVHLLLLIAMLLVCQGG